MPTRVPYRTSEAVEYERTDKAERAGEVEKYRVCRASRKS